tara:strand:+ start:741 stop:1406 length:666 start_codon:yes stop_codon:yes gene_type:complete
MIFFLIIKKNSVRIKKKNFIDLKGKKLWKITVEKLKNYKVYIDTDSEEIIQECKKKYKHVTAYKRDKKFIDFENNDTGLSPVLLLIKNFLIKFNIDQNESIITTHVTSPYIRLKTIIKAEKYLKKYEFVHSVSIHHEFGLLIKNNKFKEINFKINKVQKTQNLEPIYFSNGAFFIFKKKTFLKYNNRLGKNTYFFPIKFPETIEIDTHSDIDVAQNIKFKI